MATVRGIMEQRVQRITDATWDPKAKFFLDPTISKVFSQKIVQVTGGVKENKLACDWHTFIENEKAVWNFKNGQIIVYKGTKSAQARGVGL